MTAVEPLVPLIDGPLQTAPKRAGRGSVVPSIRVNLLPAEFVSARRSRRTRRFVGVGLVLLVLVLTGVSFLARAGIGMADDDLASARAVNADLVAQQRSYAEVVAAQAAVATARQRIDTLAARDVAWATLLSSVRAAAPAGVEIGSIGVTAAVAAVTAAAPPAAGTATTPTTPTTPAAPGTASPATVAALTVSGTASDPGAVAALVDRLTATTGLAHVAATSVDVNATGGGYDYRLTADVTAAALAAPTGNGGGR